MRASLNLIVIRASDLDSAACFYAALGLALVRERHGDGPEHLVAGIDGVVFEVYPQGEGPTTQGVRLGFRVGSVAATVESALAAGGTLVRGVRESEWGVRAVVADPDGHRIELVEAPRR